MYTRFGPIARLIPSNWVDPSPGVPWKKVEHMSVPERVVSLLPGATELVWALGAGSRLVAVSHECDYPPQVLQFPKVTRCWIDTSACSRQIDRQTRSLYESGQPLYALDVPLLESLNPDLVITQAQCDVCAIGDNDVREQLARSSRLRNTQILALHARSILDLFHDLDRVADALGLKREAQRLRSEWQQRLERMRTWTARQAVSPRTVCLEWLDPPILAGNWMPQLVAWAGGTYPDVPVGEPSRVVDWVWLAQWQPDVLILMPCGFGLERTWQEIAMVSDKQFWELDVWRQGHVWAVDGNAYFNRLGPRLIDSLALLTKLLHPEFPEQEVCCQPGVYRQVVPPVRVPEDG